MRNLRRAPRITDTQDLIASLRPFHQAARPTRVRDLSEGGMLVTGAELEVGDATAFELKGPDFHYAGTATVAHHTNGTTGLHFLAWQGQADRPIRALITKRLRSLSQNPITAREQHQRVIRRVAIIIGTGQLLRPDSPALQLATGAPLTPPPSRNRAERAKPRTQLIARSKPSVLDAASSKRIGVAIAGVDKAGRTQIREAATTTSPSSDCGPMFVAQRRRARGPSLTAAGTPG